MSTYIAVDIGGTQMRAACYPADSLTPIRMARISTQHPTLSPLERLQELISSIWPEKNSVTRIGLAAPGPVDPYKGILRSAPNIPGWTDVPLRKEMEERFHVPVAIGNDANLAALGEGRFGAGRGHPNLIFMTISTGIGGGIIIDDRLLLGSSGLAGEVGHITILPDGPLCGCGQRGHLEAVASGTAIAHWVEQELAQGAASRLQVGQVLTAKQIAHAAKEGDQLAIAAFNRAGYFLGLGLANYCHIFNPSIVIFGGGVSQAGPLLFDPMNASLQTHILSPHYLENLTLTTASLGDEAGLMGALALARMDKVGLK
jgi:glucokinase